MCKIRKVGNYFFAFAGFHDEWQIKYATQICLSAKSFADIVNGFPHLILKDYANAVEHFRKQDLKKYVSTFAGKDFAMVSFFTIENNIPQLITFYFLEVNPPDVQARIKCEPSINNHLTILGAKDAVMQMPYNLQVSLSPLKDTNTSEFIRKTIEFAIYKEPYWVNGPIDLLELSPGEEPKWLQRKTNCID